MNKVASILLLWLVWEVVRIKDCSETIKYAIAGLTILIEYKVWFM